MSLGDLPFRLGPWRIDPVAFEATRGAESARLEPKAVAVLVMLAEHAGEVVSRETLFDAVWPDVVVTDASLTRCVSQLRQVLGDDARTLIETIPKAGYRLHATPEPLPPEPASPEAPPVTPRRRSSPVPRRLLAAALAVVVLAVATVALVTTFRPAPALTVDYRIDVVGDVTEAAVTYTGPDGLPVTVRPDAFPVAVTIEPSAPGGTFRLQLGGRSTGADVRLSIVARRGDAEAGRQVTTATTDPGPAQAMSVFALLTVDEG